jgi:hypothetical protein
MNNIPETVNTLKIFFSDKDKHSGYVDNLPITIKKIIINDMSKKHLVKIPFGCEIVEA